MTYMSQKQMLEARVREILGSGMTEDAMGAGAIADFFKQLASGVPLPLLLLNLKMGKKKGAGPKADMVKKMISEGYKTWEIVKKLKEMDGGCNGMPCSDKSCGGGINDNTRKGQARYLAFMKEHKTNGMTHQEALEAWRKVKCEPGKFTDLVVPPPQPKTGPKKSVTVNKRKLNREITEDQYTECMKLLGLKSEMVKQSQEENVQMAEQMQDQMIKDLREREGPTTEEQLALEYPSQLALEYPTQLALEYPMELNLSNIDEPEQLVNAIQLYEEPEAAFNPYKDPDCIRCFNKAVKVKGSGRKMSDEHRAKLDKGRLQFQHFMKTVKEKGLSHQEALALYRKLKEKHGGKWYDDFWRGFKMPFEAVGKVLPHVLPFVL